VPVLPGNFPLQMMLLLACLLAAGPLSAADSLLTDIALVKALRAGGFNIYFRHVSTDWSQSDDVRQVDDWRSCDPLRMRQLSAAGRAAARAIGMAMRRLAIPVDEVLASPYCRTVETAKLMDLGKVVESMQVMNLRSADYVGGRASVVANAQALLASAPGAAVNRVIVAHGNVAREATSAYPGEGEALVFEPDATGGFVLRGRIAVGDWARLVKLANG
jgi:phosphohistidine phosphatase SixA